MYSGAKGGPSYLANPDINLLVSIKGLLHKPLSFSLSPISLTIGSHKLNSKGVYPSSVRPRWNRAGGRFPRGAYHRIRNRALRGEPAFVVQSYFTCYRRKKWGN